MRSTKKGFTLIELMIVIAIISILAALSIPSYERYLKRARFMEIVTASSLYKTAIALALQEGIPISEISNNQHGIPEALAPSENIDSMIVEKGTIKAIASNYLDHVTYILKPNRTGTQWSVSGTCLRNQLCHA